MSEDVIWVPVLPSLRDFARQLGTEGRRAGQEAGQQTAQAMAEAVSKGQAAVAKAVADIEKLRNREADATGKARVAQEELNKLLQAGETDTVKLTRAREKLAAAERKQTEAQSAAAAAVDKHQAAQRDLESTMQRASQATEGGSSALSGFTDKASAGVGKLKNFAIAAAGIGTAVEMAMQAIENIDLKNTLAASLGATGSLAAEYGGMAGDLWKQGVAGSMEQASEAVAAVASTFKVAGSEGERAVDDIAAAALNFSTIFGTDVNETVQTANQLITNGLAKDSTEAFDLMTAAWQRTGTGMRDELGELMNEYGTFFSSLGFSGQEAFGMLVNASDRGKIAMDKVGDALKEFGIRATDIGDQAAMDALTGLGLNANDTANALLAGGDAAKTAFGNIVSGLLKIDDPAKQASAALAVIGTPMEDLNKVELPAFLQAMSGAGDAMAGFEGSAQQAADTLNSGPGAAIRKLKNTIQGGITDAFGVAAQATLGAVNLISSGVGTVLGPAIDTAKLFIGTITGSGADVDIPWMNTVIDAGTRVRGVIDGVRTSVSGVWEFITTGNIGEDMARLFNFDLPILGKLEDLRNLAVDVVNEVIGGFRAMVAAFTDGGTDATSSGLAGYLERVGLVARGLWDGFTWGLGILREVWGFVSATFGPIFSWLAGIVLDLTVGALQGLWDGLQRGYDVINTVIDAVMSVVDWFTRHKDVAIAIAGVIGAMLLPALASMVFELGLTAIAWGIVAAQTAASTIATTAHTVATKAANAASKAWAAGVWLVNAALSANPIVLVIGAIAALVAGIVLAYRHSETFRNIVQAAWEGIQTAAGIAWDFLKGVFAWFGDAFTWIGEKATWLWQNVISPVFEFIGNAARVLMAVIGTVLIAPFLIGWNVLSAAIQYAWNNLIKPVFNLWAGVATWLWTSVLQPVWGAMQVGLQALGAFFGWVWNTLIKPAWDGLGAGISWVWENVIRPAWDGLKVALQAVGAFFGWVWNTLIKPAWDGLGAGISWVWENVIRPAWDGLKVALQAIGDFFGWVWNTLIKPAWDGLGAGISWVWDNVIRPVFEGIQGGLGAVRTAFDEAVKFIERVWEGIRGAVAKPIKFVIDSVYNNGIRAAWNKVAGFVGLDELPEYKPEWLGAYASGTSVLPGYSPGVDNMRFVSTDGRAAIDLGGGEAILRPEVTKAVGPQWVDGVNAAAAAGGTGAVQRYLGGFAGGGIVESIIAIAREHFPGLSVTSSFRDSNDLHGQGKAVDLSNQVAGGPSTPLMQDAARFFYEGYGPQLAELIHWPLNGWENIDEGQPFDFGPGTNAEHTDHVHVAAHQPLGAPDGDGGNWLSRTWGSVKRGLRSMVEKLFDSVIDPIGNAIPDFGGSTIGQFPRKVFDTLKDKAKEFLLGKADEQGSGPAGGGAEQWRQMMIEAYRNQGYDPTPAKIDAWMRQIATESGGDPNIAQQIVDVNGTGEAAGVGLGQMIPTTWAAYRDPSLPDDRRDPWAMLNAMVRYGEQKYGADLLDVIGQGHGYDQGGIADGTGLMPKKILKPERVLSPAQTAAWEALVPHLIDVEAAMEAILQLAGAGDFTPQLRQLIGSEEDSAVVDAVLSTRDGVLATQDAIDGLIADLESAYADVPQSALEEHSREALDFFGLGKWGDLLFADQPQSVAVEPDPVADGLTDPAAADTVTESDRHENPPPAAEPGPRAPLVNIEEALAFDLNELVEMLTRELRHVVLSDGMNGGWDG
ncbi:phage tail tape measure protein [Prescottella equi]|uniref:phage tail tape measure protein n=1 Tax=Rhodococcus hoagii TaxID=43767 RepID=UPI000A92E24E|nr:phage tail tape measure protein [Prescottella equi]